MRDIWKVKFIQSKIIKNPLHEKAIFWCAELLTLLRRGHVAYIFPVIVLVLVIVLLQCLPSSFIQSYRINIAKTL